ncbi:MAG: hypothetical protein C0594_02910 [Marinilabiliales bacterium]|nr:MAG: hypothetical protein C0594_02910 [Marinilabiliales bacterium]
MKVCFVLLFSIIWTQLVAQDTNDNHVKWDYTIDKQQDSIIIQFKADIEDQWHMYSQKTEGTMPLYFSIIESDAFDVISDFIELSPFKEKYEEVFDANTIFFDVEASFKQIISRKSKASFTIEGSIDYQICKESICVPESYKFSITID